MNLYLNITIIAAATAVLFTYSHAAPTAADVNILPHPNYQGQVQQDPIPDPGIGDWFVNIYNIIVKVIAKALELDRNPKKLKYSKISYIKRMRRNILSPAANFIRQYNTDDVVTNNLLIAMNNYLLSLEKLVKDPSMLSREAVENTISVS